LKSSSARRVPPELPMPAVEPDTLLDRPVPSAVGEG
jgi:hypothetical protein